MALFFWPLYVMFPFLVNSNLLENRINFYHSWFQPTTTQCMFVNIPCCQILNNKDNICQYQLIFFLFSLHFAFHQIIRYYRHSPIMYITSAVPWVHTKHILKTTIHSAPIGLTYDFNYGGTSL